MSREQKKTLKIVILYIVFAVMVIVSLFPILYCVMSSLRTQQDLSVHMLPFTIQSLIPQEFTLENYVIIFTKYTFWRPLLNTVVVTAASIVIGCIINSMAAFAFTCFEFKGRRLFFMMVMLSFMVPFESIAIPLYATVSKLGMVDTYAGMVLPAVADGMVIFLFIQFFKDLPVSLIEAARVDGASWPKIFVRVIIPIAIPIFVTASLMIFMGQWNSYMWPLLVARTKEIRTVQIAISAFYGEYGVSWTYVYAATVVAMLFPIALFVPLQKYYVEGITAGSVKG